MQDITGRLCELHSTDQMKHEIYGDKVILMYSYSRPSSIFWNAIYNALINQGWSEEKAIEWLRSKDPRWMLDNHETEIQNLAEKMIAAYEGFGRPVMSMEAGESLVKVL